MSEHNDEKVQAFTAYVAAKRPPLCPRCGGWDGPQLPFCTDHGWQHRATCSRYVFAPDPCEGCNADHLARPEGDLR